MSDSKQGKAIHIQQQSLSEYDPEIYKILEKEKRRQWRGLELIASENFTSQAVFDCLGSALSNKYSEGLPGKRYYGGNEYIDVIENLCIARAQAAFHLDAKTWGVNVQPYSGSPANFAVYTAVLKPHDRVMGLDLPSGGHLTHGYYTAKKKISATSIFFESYPYSVNGETGLVDYAKLKEQALVFRPSLIICGGSAYPREWEYAQLRKIADACGSLLMCDMAHISGLVATQQADDPFQYCDLVTTTTHKTLRGPRGGMIFFNKEHPMGFEQKVNFAVFPSIQGGPHDNTIAGIAVQLKEVATDEFRQYAARVVKNSKALAKTLMDLGYTLAAGGSDNHLLLINLRPLKVTGSKMESLCDHASITLNKNTIHGDKSAMTPGGVRIGTPALTSRGFEEKEFEQVGQFLHRAIQLCVAVQKEVGSSKLSEFKKALPAHEGVKALKADVETFAKQFPMPGMDIDALKYKE